MLLLAQEQEEAYFYDIAVALCVILVLFSIVFGTTKMRKEEERARLRKITVSQGGTHPDDLDEKSQQTLARFKTLHTVSRGCWEKICDCCSCRGVTRAGDNDFDVDSDNDSESEILSNEEVKSHNTITI